MRVSNVCFIKRFWLRSFGRWQLGSFAPVWVLLYQPPFTAVNKRQGKGVILASLLNNNVANWHRRAGGRIGAGRGRGQQKSR
jgi:hypothetical protein